MKRLTIMTMLIVTVTSNGFTRAATISDSLLIRNSTKKPISYEFTSSLKKISPTKATGEIAAGAALAFKPATSTATINFFTKNGKTVAVTTKTTGEVTIKKIGNNDIEFTKISDKKDPSTALISVTIE